MASTLRKLSLSIGVTGGLLIFACSEGPSPFPGPAAFPFSPFPGRPVKEVLVYSFPYAMQQGDTLMVTTESFDSTGLATAFDSTAKWSLSDKSVTSVVRVGNRGRAIVLRGVQPGTVRLFSMISKVTGTDTVRVVPPLAPLRLEPASVTLRRGDSVAVRLRVTDLQGVPVPGLLVFWSTDNSLVATAQCCRDSTYVRSPMSGGPGSVVIHVKILDQTIALPVTVTSQ